jgi:hypothetical protein
MLGAIGTRTDASRNGSKSHDASMAAVVDERIVELAPDRIADLLRSLTERQAAKSGSTDRRLLALQREVSDTEDRLKRLLVVSDLENPRLRR